MIDVGLLDALVFCSPILEPDFDLGFAQTKGCGQFGASGPRNVLGWLELDFQTECLLLGERCPLPPLTQTFAFPSGHFRRNGGKKMIKLKFSNQIKQNTIDGQNVKD